MFWTSAQRNHKSFLADIGTPDLDNPQESEIYSAEVRPIIRLKQLTMHDDLQSMEFKCGSILILVEGHVRCLADLQR